MGKTNKAKKAKKVYEIEIKDRKQNCCICPTGSIGPTGPQGLASTGSQGPTGPTGPSSTPLSNAFLSVYLTTNATLDGSMSVPFNMQKTTQSFSEFSFFSGTGSNIVINVSGTYEISYGINSIVETGTSLSGTDAIGLHLTPGGFINGSVIPLQFHDTIQNSTWSIICDISAGESLTLISVATGAIILLTPSFSSNFATSAFLTIKRLA